MMDQTSTPTKGGKRLPVEGTGSTPKSKVPHTEVTGKQLWSHEEDEALRSYIKTVSGQPNKNWKKCSEFLLERCQTQRSAKACANRYHDHLKKDDDSSLNPQHSHTQTQRPGRRKKSDSCCQTDYSFSPSADISWKICDLPKNESERLSTASVINAPTIRHLLTMPMEDLGVTPLNDDSGYNHSHEESITSPKNPTYHQFASRSLFTSTPQLKSVNKCAAKEVISQSPCMPTGSEPQLHSNVSPSLGASLPSSQENSQHLPAVDKTGPSGDHLYAKSKGPARKKRMRKPKIKPGVSLLACKLSIKKEKLSPRQKAQLKASVSNMSELNHTVDNILAVPPVKATIISQLAEDLSRRPDDMRRVKHGFVSVLMDKDFDNLQNCNFVDIVAEFHEKFPELFTLVLAVMRPKKKMDITNLAALIPKLAMVYSIILQSRVPALSRMQRVLSMALTQQICNQKIPVLTCG